MYLFDKKNPSIYIYLLIMKKKEIEEILLKIKPETKKFIKKKVNFVDDALLDSFDIMRFLVEIQKKKKEKKINFGRYLEIVFII